jgi:hypothetical protein
VLVLHIHKQKRGVAVLGAGMGGGGGLLETQSTYICRDETGSVYLPTQLERTLQLYW